MTRAQKIVTRIFNLTSNRLRIRSVSSVKGDSRLITCCGSMGTLSSIQKFCFCVDVTKIRNGERRSQNGVRGTGNAERRTCNKEPETGSREWQSSIQTFFPCCYPAFFKLLCGLPLYFRSQFLFLVSRSPFLILITSISCWPKFKLLFVFQCL